MNFEVVSLINRKNKWPKSTDPIIFPPLFKRGPGTQNKLHRKEPDDANHTKWQRINTSHQYKKCLEYGHNSRTCNKDKQFTIIPGENTITITKPPIQVSQAPSVQKVSKKLVSLLFKKC